MDEQKLVEEMMTESLSEEGSSIGGSGGPTLLQATVPSDIDGWLILTPMVCCEGRNA
jgi:hypothetical protein